MRGLRSGQNRVIDLLVGRVGPAGQGHIACFILLHPGVGARHGSIDVFGADGMGDHLRQLLRAHAEADLQAVVVEHRFQVSDQLHTQRDTEGGAFPGCRARGIGVCVMLRMPERQELGTYGRTARLGRLSELVPACLPACAQFLRRGIFREPRPERGR